MLTLPFTLHVAPSHGFGFKVIGCDVGLGGLWQVGEERSCATWLEDLTWLTTLLKTELESFSLLVA